MVLILLAMGALLITPTLRLAQSSLSATRIHTEILEDQYARDGAAEYAIWQLQYGGLAQILNGTNDQAEYTISLNGQSVEVIIKLRAELGLTGAQIASDVQFQVTKTVNPDTYDTGVGGTQTFTYSITMHRQNPDEPSNLNYIRDLFKTPFSYVSGSSVLTTYASAGGPVLSTETLADPGDSNDSGYRILRWPSSGSFPSTVSGDIGFFEYDQKKVLTFDVTASSLAINQWYCDNVFLEPWNEYLGSAAPIKRDDTTATTCGDAVFELDKTVTPIVAQPGVLTTFTYTITIKNTDNSTRYLCKIIDTLPEDFNYVLGSSAGDTTATGTPPWVPANWYTSDPVDVPHPTLANRRQLTWDPGENNYPPIASGATVTQKFQASATLGESGTSFNEFTIIFNDDDGCDGFDAPDPLMTTSRIVITPRPTPTAQGPLLSRSMMCSPPGSACSAGGNVSVNSSDTSLESWHVESK